MLNYKTQNKINVIQKYQIFIKLWFIQFSLHKKKLK